MERLDLTKYEDHTAGPWGWDSDRDDLHCPKWEVFMLLPGGPARNARPYLEFDDDIKIANADRDLIADAPTLLSALEAAYAEIDRLSANGWVKVKDATVEWREGDHCMILCDNGEQAWRSDMGFPVGSEPGPGWFYELDRNYYERCDPEWRLFRVPCPPEEERGE